MKNILIISDGFYPQNSPRSFRATELAKEFHKQGNLITIAVPYRQGIDELLEQYSFKYVDLGEVHWQLPRMRSKGTFAFWISRFFDRILSLIFAYPEIQFLWKVWNVLCNMKGYDLMISIAVPYPIHWGVAWSRRADHRIAKIWVADCGDPYYGLENDTFRKPFYFAWIEKWFMRKADYISIPFEGARKAYFSEFHEKMVVIPQGFAFPESASTADTTLSDTPSFAYMGNVSSYQHYAIPFLQMLHSVDLDFRFLVYTSDPDFYYHHLDNQSSVKCVISDYLPRETLLNELAKVDFLIYFPYQKETQRSLKLIDYAFLQKPILRYQGSEECNQAFISFLKGDYSTQYAVGDIDSYRIENVVREFLKLIP